MIVFELICTRKHRFEGWFASAEDFDGQKARGLLECPVCSDKQVDKLLTAKIRKSAPEAVAQPAREFANEARRIHYEQAPERAIRGVASREETEELLDEGITVMPLPVPPQSDWH